MVNNFYLNGRGGDLWKMSLDDLGKFLREKWLFFEVIKVNWKYCFLKYVYKKFSNRMNTKFGMFFRIYLEKLGKVDIVFIDWFV